MTGLYYDMRKYIFSLNFGNKKGNILKKNGDGICQEYKLHYLCIMNRSETQQDEEKKDKWKQLIRRAQS